MVTMVSTSLILPYVQPKAPGVSVLMAEFQIRQAAIEFCARTRIWRHSLEQVMAANNPVLVVPDYAAIHDIERADFALSVDPMVDPPTYDEPQRLTAVPFSDLPPAWASDPESPPECITQVTPNTVIVYPFKPGKVTLTVYLKPRNGQDYTRTGKPMDDYFNQIPNFLVEQHAEAIASGALARILTLPKKPYSDPAMSDYHRGMFDAACDHFSNVNKKGQQRAPRRFRYNDF